METFLLVVALVVAYFIFAGFVGNKMTRWYDRHTNMRIVDCQFTGVISGIFWPFVLPITVGISMAKFSPGEYRREKEIKQAEHQAELARIKRIEEEETNRRLQALQ